MSYNQPQFGKKMSLDGEIQLENAAKRALAEADERRENQEQGVKFPRELDGRGGLDPVRYGDWEVKGIISDF